MVITWKGPKVLPVNCTPNWPNMLSAQGLADEVVEDEEVEHAEEAVEPAVEPAGAGLRRKLVTVPGGRIRDLD